MCGLLLRLLFLLFLAVLLLAAGDLHHITPFIRPALLHTHTTHLDRDLLLLCLGLLDLLRLTGDLERDLDLFLMGDLDLLLLGDLERDLDLFLEREVDLDRLLVRDVDLDLLLAWADCFTGDLDRERFLPAAGDLERLAGERERLLEGEIDLRLCDLVVVSGESSRRYLPERHTLATRGGRRGNRLTEG